MSNESRWLSPPVRKTRITDFARGCAALPRPGFGSARGARTTRQQLRQSQPQQPREPHLDELAAKESNRMSVRRFHSVSVSFSFTRADPGPVPASMFNQILTRKFAGFYHKIGLGNYAFILEFAHKVRLLVVELRSCS